MPVLREGTLLKHGTFVVVSQLGRGGFGEVYLARQPRMQREVAIKVLLPHVAASEDVLRRFEREALAAASLSHPHVLPVYDFDFDADAEVWFLAMQYVPGGTTLMDCLGEPVDLTETARVIIAVGGALDAAHARGIVHRDVKPANVLLDGDRPLLTDFGIAHLGHMTGITGGGLAIGTPQYMSPEQAMGKPVTARSDQYALAAIAYEMLAGRPPFTGDALSVMMQHVNIAPPPLTTFNPAVEPAAWDAIQRAMTKNPEERYGSCGEFGTALLAASTQSVGIVGPAGPTLSGAPARVAASGRSPSLAPPHPEYAGIDADGLDASPATLASPETERAPSVEGVDWMAAPPTAAHPATAPAAAPTVGAPDGAAIPPSGPEPAPAATAAGPASGRSVAEPASAEAERVGLSPDAYLPPPPSLVSREGAVAARAPALEPGAAGSRGPVTGEAGGEGVLARQPVASRPVALGAAAAVAAVLLVIGVLLVPRLGPTSGPAPATTDGGARPPTGAAVPEVGAVPPPPPAVIPAAVRVTSNPDGAGISVDGEPAQRTPRLLSLRPGVYEIVVTAPTYRDAVRRIEVAEGQELAVPVDLEPLPAAEVLEISDRRLGSDPYVDASGLIRLGRTTERFRVSEDVNAVVYLKPKTFRIRDLSFTTVHRWQRAGGPPIELSSVQPVPRDWDETFIRACAPAGALDVRGSNTPLTLEVLIEDTVVAEFSFRVAGGNLADASPSPCDATALPRTIAAVSRES